MVVTAVFLCRSMPAHRSYSTCISSLPLGWIGQSNERCGKRTSFLRVLTHYLDGDIHLFWAHLGQLPGRVLHTIKHLRPHSLVPLFYRIFIPVSASLRHGASRGKGGQLWQEREPLQLGNALLIRVTKRPHLSLI